MTFRISPELRERLAAAAGDRPIGEEIRRRLDASFATGAAAPQVRSVLSAILAMPPYLSGEGFKGLDAFALFELAIRTLTWIIHSGYEHAV